MTLQLQQRIFGKMHGKSEKMTFDFFHCAMMSMNLSSFLITRLVNKFSKQYKQLDRFDIISHTCKCELPTRVILSSWRLLDATAFYCHCYS